MNETVKEKWVVALESGDYEQVYGQLGGPKGFCCLGVLCELAVAEGVVTRHEDDNSYGYGAKVSVGVLPDEVVEWAGLNTNSPTAYIDNAHGRPEAKHLASRNDAGHSFKQIAEWIREGL